MNNHLIYLTLNAQDWPGMQQQVKAAVNDYWHQHAGHWQPETISLHVATRLLPDTLHAAQRDTRLPLLVAWLRQQARVITVLADPHLPEHRLYLHCADASESGKKK
jgi:hypothetical protein